jgi:outer membrane protein TolC
MSTLAAQSRPAAALFSFTLVTTLIFALCANPSLAQDKPPKAVAAGDELPESPIERAQKNGTALPLSLKDLTKLALQNNLDLAIQDTNEELYRQRVIQSHGVYDPMLTATLSTGSRKRANTNLATASTQGAFSQTDSAAWNFAFSQPIKTGGTLSVQWNSDRSDSNTAFSLFNPQYTSGASVTFTQPLLRNFRIDQNRGQIKLVNLDLEISDSQFKQKVVDTVSNIQSQYWDLVAAIGDYNIKRNSVRLAQITLRDNKKRVEIGTLAPIGITEAEARVAQREVEMIAAEERILNVENTLRSLISNDRNAEIWQKVIVPTETPDFKEYAVSLDAAIEAALANRPELEQIDFSLQQSEINQRMTEDSRKWQWDLQASFGSTGVAGPQSFRQVLDPITRLPIIDPVTGQPRVEAQTPPNLIGGIGNAYRTIFTEGFTNWSVGFQVQIPLRNRRVDAQLAQQKIQERQTLMRRKNTEQSIQVEVQNAIQKLETTHRQVRTAGVSRRLAEEQLHGEEKRFEAGLSENFRVLDQQNALAQAEYTELQALMNYRKAIIALQKAMFTLLESNEFEIAKSSSETVARLK